jgi:hypothetical protein
MTNQENVCNLYYKGPNAFMFKESEDMGNSNSIMETEQRGGKKIQRNTNGLNT